MIGRLQGTLADKNPPQVLVDCNGVGYEVDVPDEHLLQPAGAWARRCRCSRTSWCARTRRSCTASARPSEREAFRQLIKISGVGPRTALSVLSAA